MRLQSSDAMINLALKMWEDRVVVDGPHAFDNACMDRVIIDAVEAAGPTSSNQLPRGIGKHCQVSRTQLLQYGEPRSATCTWVVREKTRIERIAATRRCGLLGIAVDECP